MSRPREHGEDEDWAWAREHARKAPKWSDARWRQVNAILGLEVTTRKARPGGRTRDGPH